MRFVYVLLAVAATLLPLSAASQDSEEATIRTTFSEYLTARNNQDAAAVAEFFADDYDQSNLSTGQIQIRSGKERAETYARSFREGSVRNEMTSEIENLRMLTKDAAILDTELAFVDEDGNTTFRNFASFVFVKRDGAWLIGAVRLSPYTSSPPSQ